jgi:hypothetical protein
MRSGRAAGFTHVHQMLAVQSIDDAWAYDVQAAQAGWPFRSVVSMRLVAGNLRAGGNIPPFDKTIGIETPRNLKRVAVDPRRLLPINPNLMLVAANAIVYFATIAVLITAAMTVRRFVRLRHGRCPACAYQLENWQVLCPECGLLRRPE